MPLPPADVLLDLLPDPVCVVDVQGRFLQVSAAFQTLFGHAPQSVLGQSMESLIHPDDLESTRRAAAQVMDNRPIPHFRNRYRHRDGHYIHVQWSARWLPEHAVRIAVAHEVGALQARESALAFQALHDPLTGLPNRAHLMAELSRRLEQARTGGPGLALLYLDVDGLKQTNDRLGHAAGDRLLCQVADILHRAVRHQDVIARIGGDEFVVLLADCRKPAQAIILRDHLKMALQLEPGQGCRTGASIGVSLFPVDGEDPDILLQAADARMYNDKLRQRDGLTA